MRVGGRVLLFEGFLSAGKGVDSAHHITDEDASRGVGQRRAAALREGRGADAVFLAVLEWLEAEHMGRGREPGREAASAHWTGRLGSEPGVGVGAPRLRQKFSPSFLGGWVLFFGWGWISVRGGEWRLATSECWRRGWVWRLKVVLYI